MHREQLRQLKKRHGQRVMQQYNGVVGVGISEKVKNGKPTGELALTVYVKKKHHASVIQPEQRIDRDVALLVEATVADIDIKEIGEIRALAYWPGSGLITPRTEAKGYTKYYRPVWTGASEGHYRITAGTGSVILVDPNGVQFRLSNNHVYADQNAANIGDAIYQPGPYDGGQPIDTVGDLHLFEPLKFDGTPNYLDAALRTLREAEVQAPLGLNVNPTGIMPAEIGMAVVKSGRTTEVTRGLVTDVEMTVTVGYGGTKEALFEDQILVTATEAFSQGGDSGSAVFYDHEGLPWVGLLFAGDEYGGFTIVNHAHRVLTHFGMQLASGGEIPEPPENGKPGCNPFTRLFGR